MGTKLEQLKKLTTVVADTGDISEIIKYKPQDATTNPSLILKAAELPQYQSLFNDSINYAKSKYEDLDLQISAAADHLAVSIGCEILSKIPGRISTEVDARLSFDIDACINKAHQLVALYQEQGIKKERILIKLAATWEGICAAKELEKQGINCNLTLLFSFAQARACAEANVYLISPFVGRIMDWYKAKQGHGFDAHEDPGVLSVTKIYNYYKMHGYSTVVMGASFRNIDEVLALAGCDRLTIGPALLEQLSQIKGEVTCQLSGIDDRQERPTSLNQAQFLWEHNQDAMAVEKLAEGIRLFAVDQQKLEQIIRQRF